MRTGEDFVFLQDLISRGVSIESQEQFDLLLDQVGSETMLRYRRQIYAVRERLLRDDREAWLRLNRVFSHVRELLDALAADRSCYILSTKKEQFILEILAAAGICWPPERAICSEQRPKLSIIQEILAERGDSVAHYVEDQPDHFPDPEARRTLPFTLHCYLAQWGYVQRQWLSDDAATRSAYRVIDAGRFQSLITQWTSNSAG